MAMVLFVSWRFLLHHSLRLDEAQSLWQTSRSLGKVLEIIAQDVHIPLYHTILHVWQAFLGNDVTRARILSLAFFVITIPFVYKLALSAYNSKKIALFATLLVAISPFLNWYANEVRMYSLLTLLVILNQYFFLRIYKRQDNWSYLGYVITAILGIYTHYFFSVYLGIQAVFFFIFRNKFTTGTFKKLITIWVCVGVLFLPWIYFVFSQGSASNTKPLLTTPTSVDLFNTLDQYIVGFQDESVNTLIVSLWPILVILVLLLLRRRNNGYNFETMFFGTVAFAPLLTVFFFSLVLRPFFVSRYLAYSIPSLYILISYFLSLYSPKVNKVLRVLLAGIMLAGFAFQLFNPGSPIIENYQEAVDYINQNITYQDVFIVSAPFTIYPIEYYYKGQTPINTLPIWDRTQFGQIPPFQQENLSTEVSSLIDGYYRVWLLLSYDQGYEENIRLYFDSHFQKLDMKQFSKDLTLHIYQVGYNY